MPSQWDQVDALIRALGAVRAQADGIQASVAAADAIETAIADAAEDVGATINRPQNVESLSHAQATILTARELVSQLAAEIERSRRARDHSAELGVTGARSRRDEDSD